MIRVLAAVERVGDRLGRERKWIVLPRMRKTSPLALALWQNRYRGPFTSKAFAKHVAASANADAPAESMIVWEALPLADFHPSDAPLSPYAATVPGGTCR